MISNQKYRVSNLAKDLNLKNKEITDLLSAAGFTGRNHMGVLDPEEFNIVMNYITSTRQIADIDKYLNGETRIIVEKPVKQPEKPVQTAQPAQTPAQPKPEEAQQTVKAQDQTAKLQDQAVKAQDQTAKPQNQTAQTQQQRPQQQQASAQPRPQSQQQKPAAAQTQQPRPSQQQQRQPQSQRPQQSAQSQPAQSQRNAQQQPKPQPPKTSRFDQKPQFNAQKPKPQKPQKPQDNRRPQNAFTPGTIKDEKSGLIVENQNHGSRIQSAKVVDTRTSTVDLSKYDERLETLVPVDAKNETAEKQKLKKQNNREYNKEREKERIAMEKLRKQEAAEKLKKQQLTIELPEEIVVNELAMRLRVTVAEIIKKLVMLGVMANVNAVVDYDTAALVALEFGAKVTKEVVVTIEDKLFDEAEDNAENLVERPPVVVVMGHVDHGKTSLLDAIRHTNVTTAEAGGITQHIGASRVHIKGKDITFLDTPGHEAFTAMRARGAQATDIAILVVAADDGIMPQTVEAINHAKAAGVDIIVAINKMDKYGADPENVMKELTKYELVPEEWGGDVMCVPVSALTHMGIDKLLEDILLIAEMKELKANPHRRAKGIVIEAKLDKGRGPVATVLVQNGTLNSGDVVIAGTAVGRIRAMVDDKGKNVKSAGPSVPVEIVGLSDVPVAGDEFNAVEDERMARELADQRRQKVKDDEFKANAKVNLDDLFSQIESGQKQLNIIVKADVVGSAEAVKSSLEKISNSEVKVSVIHSAVGGITEGDVMLASASNAIIVGFNVRPDKNAIDTAERQKVDIRTYRIIYECIEQIQAAINGMLAPKFKEVLLGHAEVRQTIHVPNVGTIAGSYVQDGKITRSAQIRVLRDSVVIFEDKISSLRRFKDDVKEVASGFECGVGLEKFNDIKTGDILEAYEMQQI